VLMNLGYGMYASFMIILGTLNVTKQRVSKPLRYENYSGQYVTACFLDFVWWHVSVVSKDTGSF
jgi:hypothetical protein